MQISVQFHQRRNLYIYFGLWRQKNILNFGNKRIFWTLDPIMYYMNACTAHLLLSRGRVDTDTRFRPYDDECDRTFVWTNRARHTDFLCKRRILNYGTENISRNKHTDFKWRMSAVQFLVFYDVNSSVGKEAPFYEVVRINSLFLFFATKQWNRRP